MSEANEAYKQVGIAICDQSSLIASVHWSPLNDLKAPGENTVHNGQLMTVVAMATLTTAVTSGGSAWNHSRGLAVTT